MKSKNTHGFWLRWLGVSSLHGLLFTLFWMSTPWLFTQWYSYAPLIFTGGIALIAMQFWAMPQIMRPNAKRWFSASIFAQVIATMLHASLFYFHVEGNTLLYLTSLFLPVAIAQSWALSERFKKSWLFGLVMMLPILFQLVPRTVGDNSLIFVFEIIFWTIRGVFSGAGLSFLQKYQQKESSSYSKSYERLAIQEEEQEILEIHDINLAQQKMSQGSFTSR